MTTTTEAPEECPYGEMAEEGFVYDSQYIKIAKYKAGSNDMVVLANLADTINIPSGINMIKVFAMVSPKDFIVVAALRDSWGVKKWRIKVKDSNGNLQDIDSWVSTLNE